LTEIIKKKTGKTNIGFATASGAKTRRQEYVLDAIRDYGYVREWVNRLSTVMFLPDPSLKSLETAAANGILSSFNALLGELDVMLFPHAGAIPRMAEFGLETKTFYRGIRSVWWSIAESAVSAGVTGTQMVTAKDVDAAISRVSSGSVGLPPGEDATITPDGEFDGEPDADAAGG
jgi:ATP-dependent protease Clp ATPase subunit